MTDRPAETETAATHAGTDLLKESIQFAESRVALVDAKAALVFTAVAAMFASLIFTVGDLPRLPRFLSAELLVYLALAGALVLGGLAVGYQLQAIRPTRTFFTTAVPTDRPNVEPYLMWPSAGFPESFEKFHRAAAQLSPSAYLENLAAAAYTTQQLVRLKYRFYRRAILCVKLLAAWTGFSVALLAILQASGTL